MTKPLTLLIPAAGKGSRFSDVGISTPKPLIPIWDVPMLMWVIANFQLEPRDKVIVLCQKKHNLPSALRKFTKNLSFELSFVQIENWTEGPAHSLELLLESINLDSPVVCANSDQFIFENLDSFTDLVRLGSSYGQILTMEASSNAWSYIGRGKDNRVNRVVEKREISNEATVGVYGWASARLCADALRWQRSNNQRVNGEFYVAPSYHYLIEQNLEISTHCVGIHGQAVHGLGTPTDLERFLSLSQASAAHEVVLKRLGL